MNFDLQKTIEILNQTPKTVNSLLSGLSDEWTLTKNADGKWNPYDVIGHLIHGEKTDWIPRLRIILAQEGEAKFEPFDRFAQFEDSKGKKLADLLAEFEVLRTKNIRALRDYDLTSRQMKLCGTHPELGNVTVQQLLSTWAVHDLNHIRQIVEGLAGRYSENVGPWKKYLSILG